MKEQGSDLSSFANQRELDTIYKRAVSRHWKQTRTVTSKGRGEI